MHTKRFIFAFLIALLLWHAPGQKSGAQTAPTGGQQAVTSSVQPRPADIPGNATIQTANKSGVPLTTVSDLSATVNVEAVLLPYSVAKRTFGKEVASKYAVVSLVVSNRDPKQGVILHSIFLDYSRWLFSGIFSGMTAKTKIETDAWQAQTNPSQVASAEVRTVRTDFQDAQLWSARSWVIHIATSVGTTAAALSFSTGNDLFAPSVAAFTGAVVPALGVIWPDNSQIQLNLMNDIGFRTNHAIGAKSADIVIAFFPLERFLTPNLEAIYKSAPAAFFNPSELIFEKPGRKGSGLLIKQIQELGIIPPTPCISGQTGGPSSVQCTLVHSITKYEQSYEKVKRDPNNNGDVNPCKDTSKYPPVTDADCFNVALLNRVSLNTIRVVVGGVMTVDVSSIPATISSVQIANATQSGTWKTSQKITGTVSGSFLSGGTISVTSTDPAGTVSTTALTGLQVDQTTASDSSLPFSATIGGSDIAPGTKLTFSVTKTAQDKSTTVSSPFIYTVNTGLTISISSQAWTKNTTVNGTVTGTGLTGLTITSVTSTSGTPPAADFTPTTRSSTDTALNFTIGIGDTTVPSGTTLTFTFSTNQPDGSPVTLTYKVP